MTTDENNKCFGIQYDEIHQCRVCGCQASCRREYLKRKKATTIKENGTTLRFQMRIDNICQQLKDAGKKRREGEALKKSASQLERSAIRKVMDMGSK